MICVLLANGFEEIEALAFVDILRRSGVNAVTVSTDNNGQNTGSHNIKVVADYNIKDIDYSQIKAVVLPGGLPGAYNLRDNQSVKALLDYAFDNKILMGAICASPYVVFEEFGYLKNKKATVNPAFFDDMKNAQLIKERVVCDDNIITSQGPGTTHEFAKAFVEIFNSKEVADNLITEMLYK